MNKSLVRRSTNLKSSRVEIRGAEGAEKTIEGYAAVFYRESDPDSEYWMWDDYVERMMPGCFDRAISEGHDARALFDHDPQNLLGRVGSGTCVLSVDDVGLRFVIPIDANDPDHMRVASKIRRGDLSGCSFAMNNISADWEELSQDDKTIYIRKITDLDLWDVGPVTWPAYEATEVGLRTAVTSEKQLVEARSVLTVHRQAITDRTTAEKIDIDYRWAKVNNQGAIRAGK